MKSVNPCLTSVEAEAILKATADPVADEADFPGLLGAGRVNAYKAVKMAATLYFQNTSLTNDQVYKGYRIEAGTNVTNQLPPGPVTIEPSADIEFQHNMETILNTDFEVKEGASLLVIPVETTDCQ
jgi:hypothetical protein